MSSRTKVQKWPPFVVVVTQGVGEAIEPLLFAVVLYFHEKRLQIMAWAVTRASKTRGFVGRSTNAKWKHRQVPPEPPLFPADPVSSSYGRGTVRVYRRRRRRARAVARGR